MLSRSMAAKALSASLKRMRPRTRWSRMLGSKGLRMKSDPQLQTVGLHLLGVLARHHHNGHRRQQAVALHALQQLFSGHGGHDQVEQHEGDVAVVLREQVEGLAAVCCFEDVVLALKLGFDEVSVDFDVVDDEDGALVRARCGGCRAAGRCCLTHSSPCSAGPCGHYC